MKTYVCLSTQQLTFSRLCMHLKMYSVCVALLVMRTVCDFIPAALTQPVSGEGELQGVCWDCISLVLLITC